MGPGRAEVGPVGASFYELAASNPRRGGPSGEAGWWGQARPSPWRFRGSLEALLNCAPPAITVVMGFPGEQERSLGWRCSGQTPARGSKGRKSPWSMGVWGESEVSPRGIKRRYVWMAREGSMPEPRHEPEGCNGGAPAGPLAKIAWYYHAHLAECAIPCGFHNRCRMRRLRQTFSPASPRSACTP